MQIAELASRLKVPYRHVRYVLEQGILPKGVPESPGRGEHRDLTPQQAFWLAIVLVLKENGINAPQAGEIARVAQHAISGRAANAEWDHYYNPWQGRFETEFQWFFDVGDLTYFRVATTANPSFDGLYEGAWNTIKSPRRLAKGAEPVVIIRLDVTRLGRRFQRSA